MELKKYQRDALHDIELFNRCLDETRSLRAAFRKHWADKGVELLSEDEYLHEYNDTVLGVPRVTLKVPTAGGKTFIACNALRTIFDTLIQGGPKVVVWFVPYETIMTQTLRNLNNPDHPYRQRLHTLFNGRVTVYDKETLLAKGTGFSPAKVANELSIFVLSIQSFATRTGDDLRAWRENGNLMEFCQFPIGRRVEGADETSLMQTIARLNPVVIIDESHNFTADLRVETLQLINPRYILELTATPKAYSSNVISFVDAMQLKRENMVKLPVIVYNHNTVAEVLTGAINLQLTLERKAKEAEKQGGAYIRPIVLFQAQPRNNDDNETFDKVKEKLLSIGIPESQIKIKNANVDELKGIDLLNRQCEVRYIITVDALKEGWDCPFAFILASLANKTSRISVEQILGRILRQPYTRQHAPLCLNSSYVFTCSADFNETLTIIVDGLHRSGFSPKDYVVASNEPSAVLQPTQPQSPESAKTHVEASAVPIDEWDALDSDMFSFSSEPSEDKETDIWEEKYLSPTVMFTKEYNTRMAQAVQESNAAPNVPADRVKAYRMRPQFAEEATAIRLPQFYMKTCMGISQNGVEMGEALVEPNDLLKDFPLELCDAIVNFEPTRVEAVKIDLESRDTDEYVPKQSALSDTELQQFLSYFQNQQDDRKTNVLASKICGMLESKFDAIPEPRLLKYIKNVLSGVKPHRLQTLAANLLVTAEVFRNKISALAYEYKKEQFERWIATGKIYPKRNYKLSDSIVINGKMVGIQNGLYMDEESVNPFEKRVIDAIANHPKVKFWHRNLERAKGFRINGFLNHYPDFIVMLESGKVLLVEAKGDDRDNSDSKDKITLGSKWAEQFRPNLNYFMVFDTKKVNGAFTIAELLAMISDIN